MNWACFKALEANDRTFARELFSEIGNNGYVDVWGSKEGFAQAKVFANIKEGSVR